MLKLVLFLHLGLSAQWVLLITQLNYLVFHFRIYWELRKHKFFEVSLVAILDADKEGFLRSDTTLIQTIGRAARNLRGKAILYADKVTGSMQRAMDETDRRRAIQEKFNNKNNITPKSISTKVKDIMEGARIIKGNTKKKKEDIEKIVTFKIKDDTVEKIQ